MFGRFSTEVRFRFPNKRATWRITCCRVSRSRAHAPAGWRLIGSMRSSSPSCLRPESEPNYCMIYFGRWLPLCRRVGPGGALIPFTIHPLHCSLHVTPPHRPPTASPIALAYLQPSLSLSFPLPSISLYGRIFFSGLEDIRGSEGHPAALYRQQQTDSIFTRIGLSYMTFFQSTLQYNAVEPAGWIILHVQVWNTCYV